MAYTSSIFEAIFLITVAGMWVMIFYQLFFTFMGLLYRRQSRREQRVLDAAAIPDLPGVSILIPAHNEELVIDETLAALLAMHYPAEKMEIIVINDGSTDATAEKVSEAARRDGRVRLFNVPPDQAARGKSHALNLGLAQARHGLIAVYDADNRPQPDSLAYLVRNLIANPHLAAAFGKFRTVNRKRNLLTRFINLETLAFQFMIQSGRYMLFKIAILPGTNLVIRREALAACGTWDEAALTEDTELSIRLYQHGYEIKYVPYAVTWEQEPEAWGVWVRQRTRWVRGNFYVLRKFLIPSFRFKKLSLTLELLQLFVLYYLFLAAILASHLFFIACGMGWIAVLSPGPYFAVWVCAFALFIAELTLAATYEDEFSLKNVGLIALMYFTYCQGWIVLVFRALYQEYVLKDGGHWEKTRRFAAAPPPGTPTAKD